MQIDIRIPFEPDADLGREYNRIMEESRQDWVLYLDDDVFIRHHPNWYAVCLAAIALHPEAGMFVPWASASLAPGRPQIHPRMPRSLQQSSARIKEHQAFARRVWDVRRDDDPGVSTPVNCLVSGLFMLVSRAAWRACGGFPETGELFGVDQGFCRRLLDAGYDIRRIERLYVYHLMDKDTPSWMPGVATSTELWAQWKKKR